MRDPLTKAYNRLYFEKVIEKTLAEFNKYKDVVHLCTFDLDHFKRINDVHGHDAGDEQLKYLVKTINQIIDDNTILARIGCEEFILLFNVHSTTQALEKLETIRATLEQNASENPKCTTASFGLVRYEPVYTQKVLFKLADERLYTAKNSGRNKIVYESPEYKANIE